MYVIHLRDIIPDAGRGLSDYEIIDNYLQYVSLYTQLDLRCLKFEVLDVNSDCDLTTYQAKTDKYCFRIMQSPYLMPKNKKRSLYKVSGYSSILTSPREINTFCRIIKALVTIDNKDSIVSLICSINNNDVEHEQVNLSNI